MNFKGITCGTYYDKRAKKIPGTNKKYSKSICAECKLNIIFVSLVINSMYLKVVKLYLLLEETKQQVKLKEKHLLVKPKKKHLVKHFKVSLN